MLYNTIIIIKNQMDLTNFIEKVKKLELLNEKEIRNICEKTKEILIEENNV